ncbi:MAG: glycosyltransferase family 2 protein [Candidatus Omnitrophica bacterium]|nr:glycosyltransferase family 2 protein [Candidatus Omnitrophota bacterium]
MRKRLTALLIVKNEESRITNCLDSVTWADEIVAVDGYSRDRTVDICKRYGVKVVQHRFEGSFDTECNIGIDNSSGDWILKLDADEIVTEGLRKDIEQILEDDRGFSAFKFRRKNFFLGHFMRHGGWYHYSLHFLKKGKARYKGQIHETLIVDGKVGKIEGAVEHYPFDSLQQFIERHNGYSALEARKILDTDGILDEKTIRYNLTVMPLKRFWKFYVKKKGFLEGIYGLIFSVLFAWVHFLNWAKYWELTKDKKKG